MSWDIYDQRGGVGGHRWLTPDLVFVECVITALKGGGRLARPDQVVAGDEAVVGSMPSRPHVEDAGMTMEGHAVEVAYDTFKRAVRQAGKVTS